MNKYIRFLLLLLVVCPNLARANVELDSTYGFKDAVAAVINISQEPVYSEHVQTVLLEELDKNSRTRVNQAAYKQLRAWLDKINIPTLGAPKAEQLTDFDPILPVLADQGVEQLTLVEIRRKERGFEMMVVFVIPRTGEVIHSFELPVENSLTLSGFENATKTAVQMAQKSVPFDATIIKREGDVVILDVGAPSFKAGMQLPVRTFSYARGMMTFEKTGTIAITRAEHELTFGKILVENSPARVQEGNKIMIRDPESIKNRMMMAGSGNVRQLASIQADEAFNKGALGMVAVGAGASMINLALTSADGTQSGSKKGVFPKGSLEAELWLTQRWFLDLQFAYATKVLTSTGGASLETLGSSVSQIRAQGGYRLRFTESVASPTLDIKLGYESNRFIVDQSTDNLFPSSSTYKGVSLSAGADLPITQKFGVGTELTFLLLPSLDEGARTSGAETTDVTGLEVSIRLFFNMAKDLDLEFKGSFENLSATFDGTGTRALSLASSSRNSQSAVIGLNYYF